MRDHPARLWWKPLLFIAAMELLLMTCWLYAETFELAHGFALLRCAS
jgi:hypothetical protein